MSSAVVSTSAALGRPFVFDAKAVPEVSLPAGDNRQDQGGTQESPLAHILQSTINNQKSKIPPASVTPASQLDIRPAPEMVSSGIPALDALTGGLPRGCLTEICGRLLRPHHLTSGCSGRCHATRRILRRRRRQRRARPTVCDGRWRGTGPAAMGALRRQFTTETPFDCAQSLP